MKISAILPLAGASHSLASSDRRLPILQTLTTNSTAQFIVLRRKNQKLSYKVGEPGRGDELPLSPVKVHEFAGSQWVVDWLLAQELRPDLEYELSVYDEKAVKMDGRTFKSLDLNQPAARVMIATCMHDDRIISQRWMWNRVIKEQPDIMFWVGDCVYADNHSDATPPDLLRRHVETRRRLAIFYSPKLTPVMSTWDNHDFGVDSGGGVNFPFKKETAELFWAFFGSDDFSHPERMKHFSKGPTVASSLTAFGQNFFLMDDRTFRDDKSANGRHWGDAQEEWLFATMKATGLTSWLMNGSQFFGAYRRVSESFERDQPNDFARTLARLSQLDSKVLFVSGDVHFSEVMKIEKEKLGYETYEITSSSIHSFSFPGNDWIGPNPRRLKAANFLNFIIANVGVSGGELAIDLKSVGLLSTLFKLNLKV